jgi:hypothetical protein
MDRMPAPRRPGPLLVHSHAVPMPEIDLQPQLQATHCREPPAISRRLIHPLLHSLQTARLMAANNAPPS